MSKSLVSIIIPCYNGEKFIDKSIESVYMQDWTEIELIVVDDGSEDNSAEKICKWKEAFYQKGWKLVYVYQENTGLGGAINRGLKEVSGKYLALLDADDRLLPQAVSKKANYLEMNPSCPLIRSNGWIVKGTEKWMFVWNEKEKKNTDVFTMLMKGETNNWAGSYMLRTETLFNFYRDREIYCSRYGQNLQLMLPVAYRAKCAFIDEPLMEYIQTDESLSREENFTKKKEKMLDNSEGYYNIRLHMIDILELTDNEKEYWRRVARAILYRRRMDIAIEHKDLNILNDAIVKLKKEKLLNINDQIIYWNYKFKPIAIVLRMIRRLSNGR